MDSTSTHVNEQVCIDERSRSAHGSTQWLLEQEHSAGTHPITSGNDLRVHICGETAFAQILEDIEAARDSIDIICWGFDPGMELTRSRDAWPRGPVYGSALKAAESRGVKVRLLAWHQAGMAARQQNNLTGMTGDQREGYLASPTMTTGESLAMASGLSMGVAPFGMDAGRSPEELRQDYCVQWWRDVRRASRAGDPAHRIEFLGRQGDKAAVRRALKSEEDRPSTAAASVGGLVNEVKLLEDYATHHQKTILIDYAWEGGRKAVGYVKGLNSITDYWDTQEHLFDSSKRELDWSRHSQTAQGLPAGQWISRDPYQDYACRIVGPALRGVHRNFVDAWKRAGGKARADDADTLPPQIARQRHAWRAQIVRTQPQEGDKTIKSTYYHAPQFARNYIYVENQYFYYEAWARALKTVRRKFMDALQGAGKGQGEAALLHLFVVIPWPENEGMVPRTYDTLKSLGEADSLPGQNAAMKKAEERRQAWQRLPDDEKLDPGNVPAWDPIADSARNVQEPVKNHTTGELEGLGLKVLIGRLTTHNRGRPMPRPELNYRQVYIHSKLMIIDDSFFTLGSANLNQRSMAVDSEINIATDDHDAAGDLRRRVWRLLGGGYENSGGRDGDRQATVIAFGDWKKLMTINEKQVDAGRALTAGFLVPFKEKREVHHRVA